MQQPFIKSLLSSLGFRRAVGDQNPEPLATDVDLSDLTKVVSTLMSDLNLREADPSKDLPTRLKAGLRDCRKAVASLLSELKTAKRDLSESREENKRLQAEARMRQDRQDWCSPALVEFPPETPKGIYETTLKVLRGLIGGSASLSDASNADRFPVAEIWTLYWCLVHASHAAVKAATVAKDENGISRDFLAKLASETRTSPIFTGDGGKLQVAYNAIFEQSEPGMKEAAVGADILLIVAGQGLVPNGFARLFWIQAKKARSGQSPFTLNYAQENGDGLQVDALSKVHEPSKGAFGLYMQYSKDLPYVPSVLVGRLPRGKQQPLTAKLSDLGIRLPELLVGHAIVASEKFGAFADTSEILAYLDDVAEKKPLFIVSVTAERAMELSQELAGNQLLSTVTDHYLQRFGLSPERENDRETPSQDRGMDFDR